MKRIARQEPSKDALDREKLQLEIEKLKSDFRRSLAVTLITACVTVCIAVGGWMIEQSRARASTRAAELNHRDELFSKVLNDFGSQSPASRAAAVYALTQFGSPEDRRSGKQKQVSLALLYRLADEDNLSVMEQIVEALSGFGEDTLSEAVKANKRAALEFARASGRYVGTSLRLQAIKTKASAEEQLDRDVSRIEFPGEFDRPRSMNIGATPLLRGRLQRAYSREIDLSQPSATPIEGPHMEDADQFKRTTNRVAQEWRYLRATSTLLVNLLRMVSNSGAANRLDLSGIVICCTRISHMNLSGAKLQEAVIVNVDAQSTLFNCADLRGVNFGNTYLAYSQLEDADMTRTILPDMGLYSDDELPDFSGANWWQSKMLDEMSNTADSTPDFLERTYPRLQQEHRRTHENRCQQEK